MTAGFDDAGPRAHGVATAWPARGAEPARQSGPEHLDGYLTLAIGLIGTVLFSARIDWWAYAALFWAIDVLGYWPGVAAAKITRSAVLPRGFAYLYNLLHSNSGGLALALGYALLAPGSIAAALAIPVHLGIDRGILRNRLKRPEEKF
jgi:hypothetical protein